MMITPHLVAGVAIGRALRVPWLALPVALLSHFALDALPHLDANSLSEVGGGMPVVMAGAAADTLLGVALLLWLIHRQPDWKLLFAAAFAAALPDLHYVPFWGPWLNAWPATAWLNAFHLGIQWNVHPTDWPLGFGPQLAVLAAALGYLQSRCARRRPSGRPAAEPPSFPGS